MHLDELAVGIAHAGLKGPAGSAAGAGQRVGGTSEQQTASADRQDQGVGRKCADPHGHHILAHAPAAAALFVEDRAQEIPMFILANLAGHFPAANLLVEGVEELLPGRRSGKGRAAIEGAAEAALVAEALGRAVESNAEAIHEVDDPRRPIGHFLHGWLVLQEIAAVDGIFEVLPLIVAELAGEIVDAVNAALRSNCASASRA